MAEPNEDREEDLRQLLTDAIEVQLAALKAGISFWSEWVEHTSEFVQSATKTLTAINDEDQQTRDTLLELLDAGRASMRAMTEIPRHTATRFIEELDRFEEKKSTQAAATAVARKKAAARAAAAGGGAAKSATKRAVGGRKAPRKRPKRAGRVKS